ncbi:hypothetical protein ACFLS9_05175 [Bacteroidota bacterium]
MDAVDLVKSDVGLAEPQVLEGMRNCLKYRALIIICEVLGHADIGRIRNVF